MNFLYPQFLYGLFAVAIPVFIHLFNLRRHKTVYFSDTSLLKSVQKKTRSTSQLRHLLTLLARILFIVFLVLAFAQPYWESETDKVTKNKRLFSVYLDNSLSMTAESPEGTPLQRAVQRGFNIVDETKPTDDIQFITNNFSARDEIRLSQNDVIPVLEDLKPAPYSRKISEVYERKKLIDADENERVYRFYISDFQKSFWNPESIDFEDDNAQNILIPIKSESRPNLAVDSVWFQSPVRKPGQKDSVNVRLVNTSKEESRETNAELMINGQLQSTASIVLPPGNTDTVLYFRTANSGEHYGEVKIKDGSAAFDNSLFFRYNVPEQYRVAEIGQAGVETSPVKRVFDQDDLFEYEFIESEGGDFSGSDRYALVIINEVKNLNKGTASELTSYVKAGGAVMILPHNEENEEVNTLLAELNAGKYGDADTASGEVAEVELDHPLFKGVFSKRPEKTLWPGYEQTVPFSPLSSARENLMIAKDGSPVLSRMEAEGGVLYLWSINLNTSNLSSNSIWLPVIYRSVFMSSGTGDLYKTVGKNAVIEIEDKKEVNRSEIEVVSADENTRFKPEVIPAGRSVRLNVYDQIKRSGIYRITDEQDELISYAAFNYLRDESEFDFVSTDQIQSDIERLNLPHFRIWDGEADAVKAELQKIDVQSTLWKWCIAGALIFLLGEIIFLRFLK